MYNTIIRIKYLREKNVTLPNTLSDNFDVYTNVLADLHDLTKRKSKR